MDHVRPCCSAAWRWIRVHRFVPNCSLILGREWRKRLGTPHQQIFAVCNRWQQFVNSLQRFRLSAGVGNSLRQIATPTSREDAPRQPNTW